MMQVVHPTIVKLYGFTKCKTDENESIMIVMELFERGSLADLLEQIEKSTADIGYDDTARQKILVGIDLLNFHQLDIVYIQKVMIFDVVLLINYILFQTIRNFLSFS